MSDCGLEGRPPEIGVVGTLVHISHSKRQGVVMNQWCATAICGEGLSAATDPATQPDIGEVWRGIPRRSSPGRARKVFLYSHDTYGLGHLRRNLAIAEHLLARTPGFSVRLLTGSPVIGNWRLPEGLNVTALPPVVKTGVETYAPRYSTLPFGLVKAYREALILKSVIEESPDIFLVDHAPAGMNAELLSTLAFIRRELPETQVVLGLRDILDSPETVREIWRQQGIIPLLENLYDRVLVYGCRALFDVVEGYGIPSRVAEKLNYCGYVSRPVRRGPAKPVSGKPTILVTAGGGEDGYFLMEAYLRALALSARGRVRSRIVTGPLMSAARRHALNELAGGDPNIEIIIATMDLPRMLEEVDLVVAMGGYNTSVEIIASGKPAIIVPRAAPRAEQRMRAAMLARMGLVWSVEPGAELAERLAQVIDDVLNGATLRSSVSPLDLDGARRVGDLFESVTKTDAKERETVQ